MDLLVAVVIVALVLWVFAWLEQRAARAGDAREESRALTRSTTQCYVINMHRRAERANDFLHHFTQSDLHELGLPLEVVPGVDGRKLDVECHVSPAAYKSILYTDDTGRRRGHADLTRGAVGCAMSHLDCLRRFLLTDKEYALVFEDDAVLMFRIGSAIQSSLSTARGPWDVLLLGYWCRSCTDANAMDWFGLQAYLVSREGARKVLEGCAPPFSMQLDHRMSEMARRGELIVARAASSIVPQAGGTYPTDIQKPLVM